MFVFGWIQNFYMLSWKVVKCWLLETYYSHTIGTKSKSRSIKYLSTLEMVMFENWPLYLFVPNPLNEYLFVYENLEIVCSVTWRLKYKWKYFFGDKSNENGMKSKLNSEKNWFCSMPLSVRKIKFVYQKKSKFIWTTK